MMEKKISDEAMVKSTGKRPNEWIQLIADSDYKDAPHKDIVQFLRNEQSVSHWWAQTITVLYEKNAGRRITGQTLDQGFQIGVSRTFPYPLALLWDVLTEGDGVAVYLPEISHVEPDAQGEAGQGIQYCVKVYRPGSHIRLQWSLPGWRKMSTLQLRLVAKGEEKTVVTFHQEKLAGSRQREDMRKYWSMKLDELKTILSEIEK